MQLLPSHSISAIDMLTLSRTVPKCAEVFLTNVLNVRGDEQELLAMRSHDKCMNILGKWPPHQMLCTSTEHGVLPAFTGS